jgi:hypothetical protein
MACGLVTTARSNWAAKRRLLSIVVRPPNETIFSVSGTSGLSQFSVAQNTSKGSLFPSFVFRFGRLIDGATFAYNLILGRGDEILSPSWREARIGLNGLHGGHPLISEAAAFHTA